LSESLAEENDRLRRELATVRAAAKSLESSFSTRDEFERRVLQSTYGVDRATLLRELGAVRMTKSTLASKFKSLVVRKSHKKAIVALAHKMIRLIYILLSRRQPYLDQSIDYAAISAKKNAPRWIKQLRAIGKWPSHNPPAASAAH
jgi:hypothetical protein